MKRLYAIRDCFQYFDLADEESNSTVDHMLKLTMNPIALRCLEGKRLIASFFNHCDVVTQDMTQILKSLIVLGRPYVLDAIGELPESCAVRCVVAIAGVETPA